MQPLDTKKIFSKLYLPAIACLLLWLLALTTTKTGETKVKLGWGPVEISGVPVTNIVVLRGGLALLGCALLALYPLYDYSSFFPKRLDMDVFYDQEGLRESIQCLLPYTIPNLVSAVEFESGQREYFKRFDAQVSQLLDIPQFFSVQGVGKYLHSSGTSDTVVERAQGLQQYRVTKSEGELTHVLSPPNVKEIRFYTRNKKLESGHDSITFEAGNITRGILLMTQYQQILVQSKAEAGVKYQVLLFAATRAQVFPWPRISNAVYLAETDEARLVPIAYATLRPHE